MIREAEEKDFEYILDKGEELYVMAGSVVEYDRESFRETLTILKEADGAFLFVSDDGGLNGFCGLVIMPSLWNRNGLIAHETFFYVDKSARRGGIGKLLLNEAENAAREIGCASIVMTALDGSMPSTVGGFYRSRGYRLVERDFEKEL
jgi:GNAT superfamily N-acetyltransferase